VALSRHGRGVVLFDGWESRRHVGRSADRVAAVQFGAWAEV
jgi:hypothetical protein